MFGALSALSGCGGGGGGSDPAAFPIDAAVSSFYSSSRTFAVTNEDTPTRFTLEYSLTPAADGTFEGANAKTLLYTAVLKENGAPIENAGGTDYFQVNPYRYLGSLYNDNTYEVAANQKTLPARATIGQSGDFYTSTTYTDNSKAAIEDTTIARWSLERDPSSRSRAYFCVNQSVTLTIPDDLRTISSCFRIDDNGAVLGYKLSYIYADGTSITFD